MTKIQIQYPKNPTTMRGWEGPDVAALALPLNCKITERLVLIDPRFKNHRLPTTP